MIFDGAGHSSETEDAEVYAPNKECWSLLGLIDEILLTKVLALNKWR